MEEREEKFEPKKKEEERGNIMIMSNLHLQNSLTPKKGWPQEQIGHWFSLKEKRGRENKNSQEERIREIKFKH